MLTRDVSVLDGAFDVCIVGAGPAGIACALDCRARGLRVLLIEAGGERPVPGRPDLLAAELVEPRWHDPVDIVSASALGGSSHWWGARSVPFDRADFGAWPISYEEMLPWYEKGAEFLGARGIHETPPPESFAHLANFDAVRDETLCPQANMSRRWRAELRAADGPTVFLGGRVIGLAFETMKLTGVRVRLDDAEKLVRAPRIVLACGGLGTLKLLLLAQRDNPALFGDVLGRGYMGHINGSIADMELANADDVEAFSSRRLDDGVYARRRIIVKPEAIARDQVGNIAFWLENESNSNPAHGSSVASAKYVAARVARGLAGRGREQSTPLKPHLQNIARAPASAAVGLASAALWVAQNKMGGPRRRAPLTKPSGERTWQLQYHAEQFYDPQNRVSLSSTQTDSTGAPALKIDFRFSERDFESVVRGHELLDADLRAAGAGRLKMRSHEECVARVRDTAGDGYHQLGGAIMGRDPKESIVTPDLRAHSVENLYVVAGSVFPSGSQANPTLTIVSLARRLAAQL